MKISLIGMSNVGKTYWAKKLEKKGFKCFSCDDLIEEKLELELKKLGYTGIHDVAKWMGQPYEIQYKETSKRYLDFEKEAVREILQELKNSFFSDENIVIDTTGSIIYTGDEIMRELSCLTTIIHLDTPDSVKKQMYESYLKNPKPVIWGESFKVIDGELPLAALKKCYPKLLSCRAKKYQKYAHLTLNYFLLRSEDFDTENLLRLLNGSILNGKV